MTRGNAIVWFEIAVSDFERAKMFYEALFQIEMPVSELQGYKIAFFPSSNNVSGAICFGESYIPGGTGTLVYLNAGEEDLNVVLERATEHGGRIIVPKTQIGENLGHYAFIIDTEGNRIALQSVV